VTWSNANSKLTIRNQRLCRQSSFNLKYENQFQRTPMVRVYQTTIWILWQFRELHIWWQKHYNVV